MTATIVTVYFVFSILLLVANGSYSLSPDYSDEVETSSRTSTLEFESSYSIDPAYTNEDISYQDYSYRSDEEK